MDHHPQATPGHPQHQHPQHQHRQHRSEGRAALTLPPARGTRGRHAATRRPRGLPAALAALTVAAAAALTWTLAPHPVPVALTVDGTTRHLTTAASTVADLLTASGVPVAAADLVVPDPSSPLEAGTRVEVVHARDLRLRLNGATITRTVTANTLAGALDSLNLADRANYVSRSWTSRLPLTGAHAVVRTPQRVELVTGGHRQAVTTTAATVAELLASLHVHPDRNDLVSPAADSYPRTGDVVHVIDVTTRTRQVRTPVPAPTIRRPTDTLPDGTEQVTRDGRPGWRTSIEVATLHDGHVVATRATAGPARRPRARVILVGTRTPTPSPAPLAATASGLDWAALAACESSGNPRAVSANGLYYGLYQFSVATWLSVGGTGLPSQASPAEQTRRAQVLYDRAGAGQWPVCGSRL